LNCRITKGVQFFTGVNLPEIPGEAEADQEGLIGDEGRGPAAGEWSARELGPPQKKRKKFSLEMACFGEF